MKKRTILTSFILLGCLSLFASCDLSAGVNNNSSTSSDSSGDIQIDDDTHEHTFSIDWSYDDSYHWREATCGDDMVANLAPHDFIEEIISDPTCLECGQITYTCSICGYIKTVYPDPIGHEYEQELIVEPTCTQKGTMLYTCLNCLDSYTEEVDPLGHDYSETIELAPTCGQAGYETIVCARCGDVHEHVEMPATGDHSFESVITSYPTCTDEGLITYTCSICEEVRQEQIPALGHEYNEAIVIDPTCGEDGIEIITCSRCDLYIETPIPLTGEHDYNPVGTIAISPTCVKEGEIDYTCRNCGYIYKLTLPATGHSFDSYGYNSSYHYLVCSVCGEKNSASSHEYDSDSFNSDANYHYNECSVCLAHLNKKEHDFSSGAFCTECLHQFPYEYELNEEDKTYLISGLNELSSEALLPETFNGYTLTKILNIGDSVSGTALDGFEYVSELTIPNSVTEIGPHAFDNLNQKLDNLKTVNIGGSSKLQVIGQAAFQRSHISSIYLPSGLTTIGQAAFNASDLTYIAIPNSVTYIGPYAFGTNTALKNANIGTSSSAKLESLGEISFWYCTSLEKVYIEAPIEEIRYMTFYDCRNLNLVSLPDSIKTISDRAFRGTNLSYIVLPAGVESIGNYAFESSSLQRVYSLNNDPNSFNDIAIGVSNDQLMYSNNWYFYSEEEPTDSNYSYWHYVGSTPTVW